MKLGLGENEKKWIISDMELTAMYAMFVGLVLLPAVIRYLVLKESLGEFAAINYPYVIGVGILLLAKALKRDYTRSDYAMLLIWALCTALMFYANYEQLPGKSWSCFFNMLFPIVLLLCRFSEDTFLRFMKHFLIVFDVLMILYVILAVEEYFNLHAFLAAVYEIFPASNFASFLERIQIVNRFFSAWGHALYNAVYFTMFFILNDIYFHCRRKKYPKILFFFLAFVGCSLCAAKTSLVVLLVYMLISCIMDWRENKWLLLGSAAAVLIAYVSGAMDSILLRFAVNSRSTPDRISDLVRYFHTGIYPLRWLKGYGARFVWKNINDLRSGFEFPLMTQALHFGILFSLLLLIGWYLYVSVRMLRRRQTLCWVGFTAMYIQISCFDGIARDTQDVFNWVCLFSMVMLNCAVSLRPKEGLVS